MDYATNQADGVRIAYRTAGAGPPVVLVHGTALSQVIWRGFGYVRELSADHTAITLDLRGHGRSGKPHGESSYRLDLFVGDVVAVLDEVRAGPADYVGYSLGGRVGFSLSDLHPARVRTFVCVAGAPASRPGSFDRVFFPGCTLALESGGMAGFLQEWEEWTGGPVDVQTRAAFAGNDPDALAAYMRAAEQDDGVPTERLRTLAARTLMLVGSQDGERLRAAEEVHRVAPNVALHVLQGAGHGDVLRHPDALPVIRGFLDGA